MTNKTDKKQKSYKDLPFTTKLRIRENSIKTRKRKIESGEEVRYGFALSKEYHEKFIRLMKLTNAANKTELLRDLIDGKVPLIHLVTGNNNDNT